MAWDSLCRRCRLAPKEADFKKEVSQGELRYRIYFCRTCKMDVWVPQPTELQREALEGAAGGDTQL